MVEFNDTVSQLIGPFGLILSTIDDVICTDIFINGERTNKYFYRNTVTEHDVHAFARIVIDKLVHSLLNDEEIW